MTDALYNKIGKDYDLTRHADPVITQRLFDLLHPKPDGKFLDVGCGTGNYTIALAQKGLHFTGVDISSEMLEKARMKNHEIKWHESDVRNLPFEHHTFDGAICTLATHHFTNVPKAFREVFRVMNAGHFVVFTSTPHQMSQYWLNHYFPYLIKEAGQTRLPWPTLAAAFKEAGFSQVESYPFFANGEIQDYFLLSGKYRPEIYLDPKVRAGISAFIKYADHAKLEKGLAQLKADIESGSIKEVIQHYENQEGDYLFVVGTKESTHTGRS